MMPGPNGSLRLFRAFGVEVFVHWTWFLAAAFFVQARPQGISPMGELGVLVSVFAIVLLHEFGHALACRSVGGVANRIVLWPLGGVAYVQPPARAGALLWSIVAGPLVNVVLVPVLLGLVVWVQALTHNDPRYHTLVDMLILLLNINIVLLVFNMLPIYPLDGGQTLQAILWFFVGRAKSLRITAVMGMVFGVIAAVALLIWSTDYWLVFLSLFVIMRSWQGLLTARMLAQAQEMGIEIEEPVRKNVNVRREPWEGGGI